MRRWFRVILVALLLAAIAPAYAIPAEFTAWLYTPDTGEMSLIDLSGQRDTFELPVAPPYDVRPFTNVVVSPDGNTIAYVLTRAGSFDQQLMVYSYASRSIIAQYPVTNAAYTSIDFGGRYMFSPDSSLLAFGYSVDPSGWEMIVIDLASFSIAAQIRSSDPMFTGIDANYGITPMPTYFSSNTSLAFALIRGGTEATEPVGAWVWDLVSNSITENVGYGMAGDVFRPTGEAIISMADSRFGSTPDAFMFGQSNTIQVYDPAVAARWPIFTRTDWSMYLPRFVFNGRQIVFVAYDGSNERTYILNRDGSLAGAMPIGVEPYDIAGVPDGFIYAKQDGGVPGLYSINLRAGDADGSLVWSGVPNTFPRIAWVGVLGSAEFMIIDPPYAAWPELAEPVVDGGSSGAGLTLRVGGQATVRTTEGDTLRVRSGPGTSFIVTRSVEPGTVVTLIDGPTSTAGFTWWNIRLPDGSTGWVVDFADGEQTLIPVGDDTPVAEATPSVAPTETPGADPSLASQLRVGDNALITTNSLRLRSIAGLGGAVIREMGRNTYVRVIGGPTPIDNFNWWQIRLLDGTTGWAAEIVGTERVITYTTAPAPTATTFLIEPPLPSVTPTHLVLIPLITPLVIATPAAPVQISPPDGHVYNIFPRVTQLTWNAVPSAVSYEVRRQWCNTDGTDCSNYDPVTTSETSYTFNFVGAQVGRWRVRAVNGVGLTGDWSPWRTFRHMQ
jgi:hypothetical protein